MGTAEPLLLAVSALVLYTTAAAGASTLFAGGAGVPRWLQNAIVPGATEMGPWYRRVYIVVAAFFMGIGQALLILYIRSHMSELDSVAIVATEFILAGLLTVHLIRSRSLT